MPRSEIQEGKSWIATYLQADSILTGLIEAKRIFVDQAFRQLGVPYIVINHMRGADKQGLGTVRVQTQAMFQCRVVTDVPNLATAQSAEARMDYLLQHAVTIPFNGYYFTCRRVQTIDRPEYDENRILRWQNLGGIFRLTVATSL